MKKFFEKLLDCLWTPFNRDALWCTCVKETYNTWYPYMAKTGMVFCHVDDRTQRHWKDIGVALKVVEIIGPCQFKLEVPFVVGAGDHRTSLAPIVVETLDDHGYVTGDWFEAYGQYKLTSKAGLIWEFRQINRVNEHVFKEPFIDYGQCAR